MHVVAFNGSPRKDGNTFRLVQHVFAALQKEGIGTELVQLGGLPVRGCTACFQCFKNKDGRCVQTGDIVNERIAKMRQANGII
jgi:multimeric flavodoxin WrbA